MPSQSRQTQPQSRNSLTTKDIAVLGVPVANRRAQVRSRLNKIDVLRGEIFAGTQALDNHRYFQLCRAKQLTRPQVMGIIKQLYCFSVFFEQLLTLRIARHSTDMDQRILKLARKHLREEFGHADLFSECLVENGLPADDVRRIRPKLFTRALYGYLVATMLHENEFVTNVAIMQAMESLALQFFSATLPVLQHHKMMSGAMQQHTVDDQEHAELGIELAEEFDPETFEKAVATINEIYRLMSFVLEEWLQSR